jgi:outer membrane protein TolC
MRASLLLLSALSAFAEVHVMTLKQAVAVAIEQNPDVVIARLERQKARDQVTIAHDPFTPKVFAGSGLAWTYGFPGTIDGNAPSIIQVKTAMSLFDRPQSYQVAISNEQSRSAEIDIGLKQQEAVYRVITLFLDAEQAAQSVTALDRELDNLTKVRDLVQTRVGEGRELPIESKRANVNVLRTRLRGETLTGNLIDSESALALALGYPAEDRVQPAAEDRAALPPPESEEASVEKALDESLDLKKLQSNLEGKLLEIKSWQAQRLPKVNLVAQYALFGKYNNYQDYFQKFSRNNTQLGASFEIPLLAGRSHGAYASQAEADAAKLRVEVARTRSRITGDLHRAYQEMRRADTAREVARADLDLARDQLSIDLAQYDEGRTLLAAVEASRATENEKWLAYYDAQHASELARASALRLTGNLVAAVQ